MEEKDQQDDITLSKVELGGWSLGLYFRIIAWPTVLAEAFSIIYVLTNKFFDFVWVVNILAFAYIAHLIVAKHRGQYKQAVVANLAAGLILGFIFALFKLVWLKNFYLFFNLIVEPVLTALVGLAVAVIVVYIYSILSVKNKSLIESLKSSLKDLKGGESMPEKQNKIQDKDIEENKLVAALGYVWILCLVPLFTKKDSKFAQFHGKQGLVLFIVEIVGMLVFWIPVIGWILLLLVVVLAVLGLVQALQGNYWEMPLIGQLAKKINL